MSKVAWSFSNLANNNETNKNETPTGIEKCVVCELLFIDLYAIKADKLRICMIVVGKTLPTQVKYDFVPFF